MRHPNRAAIRSAILLLFVLLPMLGCLSPVLAVPDVQTRLADAVVFYLNSPVALVRNSLALIDPDNRDVTPVTDSGRTLLPVRFLAENLGADVKWLDPEKTAVITTPTLTIRIQLGASYMEVNGETVPLDVGARSTKGRILVPMRAIAEALGSKVDWFQGGLIIVSQTRNLLDPKADATALAQLAARFSSPVTYRKTEIGTGSGNRTVHVAQIRPEDPRVRFEVALPGTALNRTADFTATAQAKGAKVAINANFFSAYSDIKDPIGHVMINGELVYGQSGLTSVGITANKQVLFGQPGIFTRLFADGRRTNYMANGVMVSYHNWPAYEVNTRTQSEKNAIVYTPRRGEQIAFTVRGDTVTVRNGKVTANTPVNPGSLLPIPSDGYVVFYGEQVTREWADIWRPEPGRVVELENYLFSNPDSAFTLDGMQWMISGGPDLVRNSAAAPVSTSATFADTRFTTAVTPRTAIGVKADGALLLVSTAAAKISDMKEIMLSLGCTQAINLDGGGSTGLYYKGTTLLKPGRQLATMFFVYE